MGFYGVMVKSVRIHSKHHCLKNPNKSRKNSKPKCTTNQSERKVDLFLLVCVFAERCIWCGTRPPASVLPWRRSTNRTWSWETRSSRPLWREISWRLLRTPSWSACSAPSRPSGTCAWLWSMWKVWLSLSTPPKGPWLGWMWAVDPCDWHNTFAVKLSLTAEVRIQHELSSLCWKGNPPSLLWDGVAGSIAHLLDIPLRKRLKKH